MKLPRYPIARSTTSELASARGALITPAEAARAELAKLSVVTSALDATNKVLEIERQARAEEEYTDAVFDYESRLQDYDVEIATRGFEVDENDNIIVDDKRVVKDELAYRKELADEVRGAMTSTASKRDFDKYMMQSNLRRNTQYTQMAIDRRIKALSAQAEHKVDTLVLQGKYDMALERARKGAEDGVVSQGKFDAMKLRIAREKAQGSITDALMKGTATDMREYVESLSDGKLPDGSDAMLTGDEQYSYTVKLNARINSLDEGAWSEVEKAREEQYMDLMPGTLNGSIGVEDLRQFRYVLDDDRYDKLVSYAVTASRRPSDSDSQIVDEYEKRINGLRIGTGNEPIYGGYRDSVYDLLDAMALDDRLSGEDVDKLTTRVEQQVKAVRDNPETEALLDVELTKIGVVRQGGITTLIAGVDKSNMVWASRLERDFKDAMVEMYRGKRHIVDDARAWLEENAPKYHAQVQKEILKKYQIKEPPMLNGEMDTDKLAVDMLNYQMKKVGTKNTVTGEAITEGKAREQAERDYQSYLLSIGAG